MPVALSGLLFIGFYALFSCVFASLVGRTGSIDQQS